MCSEVVENSLTLPCRHRFCRQCVTAYLESKINDGIIDITCPDLAPAPADGQDGAADVGCPELLDEALICEMISAEALHKYERRKAQNADPNLRECPGAPGAGGCGELVQVRKGKFGRGVRHDMTCQKCNHTFCLVHSNAHLGRSCREYELAEREKDRANKAAIAEFCKPCPRCKTMTEKNNGCVRHCKNNPRRAARVRTRLGSLFSYACRTT